MSRVSHVLSARINLKRYISKVIDNTAIGNSVGIAPIDGTIPLARMMVSVAGASIGTGLITIAGSTTEIFSFSQNSIVVGTKDFTTISTITISGISNGYLTIQAVNNLGQPVNWERSIATDMSVRFFEQNGRIKIKKEGDQPLSTIMMMAEPDADIKNLDNVYVLSGLKGITLAQLDFVEAIYDFDGLTHHIEAVVKQP